VTQGGGYRGGLVADAELGVDVLQMRSDRGGGHAEQFGDLAVSQAMRGEAQDFGLPWGDRGGLGQSSGTVA
jgi:hypothetical protein